MTFYVPQSQQASLRELRLIYDLLNDEAKLKARRKKSKDIRVKASLRRLQNKLAEVRQGLA